MRLEPGAGGSHPLTFTQAAQEIEAEFQQVEKHYDLLVRELEFVRNELSRTRGELLDAKLQGAALLEAVKGAERWATEMGIQGLARYLANVIDQVTR